MQRFVTPENKKWWTLGAVSVGLFMIMLDNTVVNVALPAMQRSLNLQLSELEWVVAGYALTFAAFMLTALLPVAKALVIAVLPRLTCVRPAVVIVVPILCQRERAQRQYRRDRQSCHLHLSPHTHLRHRGTCSLFC